MTGSATAVSGERTRESGMRRPPLQLLDPRARLLSGGLLLAQLMLLPAGPSFWVAVAWLVVFLFAGRPPLARLGIGLMTVAWMLALTLLLHAFTTPGHVIWTLPGLDWVMTAEGLRSGALLAGRLAALVLIGITLSLSLTSLEAIRSMDSLLSPLARIGVPVGSMTLMLGMTLRFVPTLYAEALQLKKVYMIR